MSINKSIRNLREQNDLTQEQLAMRIGMSTNGYAKLERGESQLTFERLKQIANAFDMDVVDLVKLGEKSFICLISENSTHSSNYYSSDQALAFEVDKLNLMLRHKDETLQQKDLIIQQKDQEIAALKQLIQVLQAK